MKKPSTVVWVFLLAILACSFGGMPKTFYDTYNANLWLSSMAFSPDCKFLAVGLSDKTARILDAHTGKLLETLRGHDESVESVAFSPNGKLFATGSWDTTVRVWDTTNWKVIQILQHPNLNPGGDNIVKPIAFSPDGKALLTSTGSQGLQFWDTTTWQVTRTLAPEGAREFMFSADGSRLVIFTSEGEGINSQNVIEIYDTASYNQEFKKTGENVLGVEISPDGSVLMVAIANYDDRKGILVRAVSVPDGNTISETQMGTSQTTSHFAFSTNGELAFGDPFGRIQLWDVNSGKVSRELYVFNNPEYSKKDPPDFYQDQINALTFCAGGPLFAAGTNEIQFAVWDTTSWQMLWGQIAK